MNLHKTSSRRSQTTITALSLFLALCLALPAAALSWGPRGGNHGPRDLGRLGPNEPYLQQLNLDENQLSLHQAMQSERINFWELCLKEGDNLEPESRQRGQVRYHLLLRAELAAETPDFIAVGKKLKTEYKGSFTEEFAKMVDTRVAFLSSLSPTQRHTLLQQDFHCGSKRGRHGNRGHGKDRFN
ncbi:MAG TPA: hypothetical protein ENN66_11860 [Proteobacteria bacterium]|nr:hypothetical protein [Pseudomonadota bacterium]